MNIQIVGYGVVGGAQGTLMEQLGHAVYPVDPVKYPNNQITSKADVTFICAPEKTVESIIAELAYIQYKGLVVIKSTVPTGTTRRLTAKHNLQICHNPEFLREKYAVEDTLNPSRIVIGADNKQHAAILTELYAPMNKPIQIYDPTTTETIKLAANCQRALMITFWNQIHNLCQVTGANIKDVSEGADPTKVLGVWEGGKWGTRFFGLPYDGKCLPKDMRQLNEVCKEHGVDCSLTEAAQTFNQQLLEVNRQ